MTFTREELEIIIYHILESKQLEKSDSVMKIVVRIDEFLNKEQ